VTVQKLGKKAPIKAPVKLSAPPPPSVPVKLRAPEPPKVQSDFRTPHNTDGRKPPGVVNNLTRMPQRETQVEADLRSTDGSLLLDKACDEKGKRWAIVGTSWTSQGPGHPTKATVTVLVGELHEVTVGEHQWGHPHSVSEALALIATEVEND
jgi:hypothetical protein